MSAQIKEMDALDLIGRLVINPNGVEFVVTKLTFEAQTGTVLIWVAEIDDVDVDKLGLGSHRAVLNSKAAGLENLDGWEVHQQLVSPREVTLK